MLTGMNESINDRMHDGEWLSHLELVECPEPGRIHVRLTVQPVFLKGLLLVFCCGILSAALQYIDVRGYFGSFRVINLIDSVYFLLLLSGALYITHNLDIKKLVLSLFSAIIFQTYFIAVYGNHMLETLYFIPATWLIFYWMWTEPDVMEKSGIRKSKIIPDITLAIIPSILIAIYTIIGMNAWGLKFEFHGWQFTSKLSSTFPMSLVIYLFIFTVWNELQAKGPGLLGNIFILMSLVALLSLPQFFVFFVIGRISLFQAFGGFITYSLVSVLVAGLTFSRFRNALPSAVLLTTLQAILQGAGVT
jgi:hypothetical protein